MGWTQEYRNSWLVRFDPSIVPVSLLLVNAPINYYEFYSQ